MQDVALVMLGSALGGMARYAVSGFVARRVGEAFPWGTMAVNVSGAFAIGLIAAAATSGAFAGPSAWRLAVVGFLGSYTTVSSFSLQTLALVRDGEWASAAFNIAGSLAVCLGAAGLGLLAGMRVVS
ncbi:MAG: fluoride efflux transporter CrcB [Bradyrhizobiaceae bacterium]|nr:MAG: fluoride efflux transporter CrcB [Bradyrhizobiaceae bacterium]